MKIEVIKVAVEELRIGDEWHDDGPSVDGSGRIVRSHGGMIWRVINDVFDSTNTQLFWDGMSNKCVVVPCQYCDGARGSRLFSPHTEMIIRRDTSQKEK